MTSFLNKKFSLILVILATLIIATSLTAVSAATDPVDITLSYNQTAANNTADVKFGANQQLSVWGNISAVNPVAGNGSAVGTLSLYYVDPISGNWTQLATSNFNQNITTAKNFSFVFNVKDVKYIGMSTLVVQFFEDATLSDVQTGSGVLNLQVRDPITINWTTVPDLKVGQESVFTGTVYGLDPTNLINRTTVAGVDVNVTLPNGTVLTLVSDINGNITFNYTPLDTSFNLNVFAGFVTDPTLGGEYIGIDTLVPFTAAKATLDAVVWWNSSNGYYLGDNSTVFWNLSTNVSLAGKNILGWVVLTNPNDGTEWRKIMVIINDTTGSLDLSPFIKTHDTLRATLMINGLDLNTMTQLFESREAGHADTWVYTNDSIPVRISDFSSQLAGIQVGKESTIVFNVTSVFGVPANGQLKLSFDSKFNFTVDVVNGTAIFTHVFTQAGNNRVIAASFLGNAAENLSATQGTVKKIFNVTQGNATLVLAQSPNNAAAFIGQTVTFDVLLFNFAAASAAAPKNVTITFTSAGKVVHTLVAPIVVDPTNATSATATVTYDYKLAHTPVLVVAKLVDAAGNYITSESNTLTVVVI